MNTVRQLILSLAALLASAGAAPCVLAEEMAPVQEVEKSDPAMNAAIAEEIGRAHV